MSLKNLDALGPLPSGSPEQRRRWRDLLPVLPVIAFLAAILVLPFLDLHEQYRSPFLLLACNLLFTTLIGLFVVYLAARGYRTRPTWGLLMFGCGVFAWSLSGLVGAAIGLIAESQGFAFDNVAITIHNGAVWISAICHLAGAVLMVRPIRVRSLPSAWLAASHALIAAWISLLIVGALAGWTPLFFVQGVGGTSLRQFVLTSAIVMFAVTATLLLAGNRRAPTAFLRWYAGALVLIAVGLLGVMLQSVHGSVLGWTGRSAQFLQTANGLQPAQGK